MMPCLTYEVHGIKEDEIKSFLLHILPHHYGWGVARVGNPSHYIGEKIFEAPNLPLKEIWKEAEDNYYDWPQANGPVVTCSNDRMTLEHEGIEILISGDTLFLEAWNLTPTKEQKLLEWIKIFQSLPRLEDKIKQIKEKEEEEEMQEYC